MWKKILALACLTVLAVSSAVLADRSPAESGAANYAECKMAESCCGVCE